jgi:hypothetical protein
VHKNDMAKFLEGTNKGTLSQGDSCVFPFFGKHWCPLNSHFKHVWVECMTTSLVVDHSECLECSLFSLDKNLIS